MGQLLEYIKTAGSIASCVLGVTSVFALVFKPMRQKVIGFITRVSKSSQTEAALVANQEQVLAIKEELLAQIKAMNEENQKQFKEIQKVNETQMDKLDSLQEAMEREREASKASLGNTIKHIYYKYIDKKSLPIREVEALCLLHKAYKLENGNSFVDSIFKEMMEEWQHTEK